jgi:hypothetical protein
MSSEEDWLLRPVIRGLCKYESLKDSSLDLEDFARMNDALDIIDHNDRLLTEPKK